MNKKTKIVIIGGHPTPAIALIDKLVVDKSFEVHFFGRKTSTEGDKALSLEYKLLSGRKSLTFHPIISGRLQRRFTLFTIPSLLKIPLGFFQSLFLLTKIHPDLVIGFGGYLSVPVVFSSSLLRIPIFIHEQTSVPGLSTRLTARLAQKIFVTFSSSLSFFDPKKTIFSGNLIREEIITPVQVGNRKLINFLKNKDQTIYITGGGQGSKIINDFVIKNLYLLSKLPYKYVVQTGSLKNSKPFKILTRQIENNPQLKTKFYPVTHLTGAEVSAVYRSKPIILGRSGANTVCEIFYFQLPAIFVPLGIAAGSEQLVNAQLFNSKNLAQIITDNNLNFSNFEKAVDQIEKTFSPDRFSSLANDIKLDTDGAFLNQIRNFAK